MHMWQMQMMEERENRARMREERELDRKKMERERDARAKERELERDEAAKRMERERQERAEDRKDMMQMIMGIVAGVGGVYTQNQNNSKKKGDPLSTWTLTLILVKIN